MGQIDRYKLKSNTQIRKERIAARKEKCQECCDVCIERTTIIVAWSCFILMVIAFFGKDIAAMVINGMNNCNDTMTDDMKNIPWDIETWIWVASISHLSAWFLTCCWTFCSIYSLDSDSCRRICYQEIPIWCSWAFFVSWMVIGYLMNKEMKNDTLEGMECERVVFWWCVIQTIESAIIPCIACCFFWSFKDMDTWS